MSPFKTRVIDIVRSIPEGKVVSYGQIALYAGVPRAAREVGWILNGTEGLPAGRQGKVDLPWWRVINNKGYLSIQGTKFHDKLLQKKLLEGEGIAVSDELIVDMRKYRWIADDDQLKTFQLDESYIEKVVEKYGL